MPAGYSALQPPRAGIFPRLFQKFPAHALQNFSIGPRLVVLA